jgi:hypothetical protein
VGDHHDRKLDLLKVVGKTREGAHEMERHHRILLVGEDVEAVIEIPHRMTAMDGQTKVVGKTREEAENSA